MKEIRNGIKRKYEAKEGSSVHSPQHVQEIGEFIENMKIPRTPENILEEVKKHPKHIINKYVTWDDAKAGYRWRVAQIRNIVNHISVKLVQVGEESIQIRAFHSVKVTEESPVEYVPVRVAFSDQYMRLQMVEKAFRELTYWTERYRVYQEFKPLVKAIDEFVKDEEKKKNNKKGKKEGKEMKIKIEEVKQYA